MKIKLSSVTVTWEINLIQFQQLECNTQLLKQKQKKLSFYMVLNLIYELD